MSIAATAWAWSVRGLKPAEKLVLLSLADCDNPARGCFPSHAFLSEAVGISPASVDRHLKRLEARGYFRRERRIKGDGKRLSTRYHLAIGAPVPPSGGPEKTPVPAIPQNEGWAENEGWPIPQNGAPPSLKNPDSPSLTGEGLTVKENRKEPSRGREGSASGNVVPMVMELEPDLSLEPDGAEKAGERKPADEGEQRKRDAIRALVGGKRSGINGDWICQDRLRAMVASGELSEAAASVLGLRNHSSAGADSSARASRMKSSIVSRTLCTSNDPTTSGATVTETFAIRARI